MSNEAAIHEAISFAMGDAPSIPEYEPTEVVEDSGGVAEGDTDVVDTTSDDVEAEASPEKAPEETSSEHYSLGRLTKEERASLAGLPEHAQALVSKVLARQDAVHTRRMQEAAELRKSATELNTSLEPHIERWKAQNISPTDAVRNMAAVEAALNEDPVGTLKWLAERYKVSLPGAVTDKVAVDNGTAPARDSELVKRIDQLEQQIRASQEADTQRQIAEIERINRQVVEKHPHKDVIPLVESTVPGFAAAVRAAHPDMPIVEVIEEAYEQALWANKEARAVLRDLEKKGHAVPADRPSKVERAKRAGSSISTSTRPVVRSNGHTDRFEDAVAEAFAELGIS